MKVMVTGAGGFIGQNLVNNLYNIKFGKNQTRQFTIEDVFEVHRDTDEKTLKRCIEEADFIFHLAGVNRPVDNSEFMEGNVSYLSHILDVVKECDNNCPIMLASSIQASLEGRFSESEYGRTKKNAETLLFDFSKNNGNRVLIYRYTNVFGKWCRPNYNSVVATFCYNIAHDLPITISDRKNVVELTYIDDIVSELFDAIEGNEHRCNIDGLINVPDTDGIYCYVPTSYTVTLGQIEELLCGFANMPNTLMMPYAPEHSFDKKLLSTYLSYLPKEKMEYPLKMNVDNRGIFTELIKTAGCGQVSINVARPNNTRGQHWHNSKWEIFIVVSGHGLIQERKIGTDEVIEFEVYGEQMKAIQMLPGYTHNIINLSDTDNLVTIMWANEEFNPNKPDTFFELVDIR